MSPFCYIFMNKDNQKIHSPPYIMHYITFQRNLLWFILKYVGSSLDKIIHIVIEFYDFFLFFWKKKLRNVENRHAVGEINCSDHKATSANAAYMRLKSQTAFRYLCCSGGRWTTFILWTVRRIITNHPLLCETHLRHFTFHCTVCTFITSSYSFKIHYSVLVFTCSGSHCSTSH